ncbi:glutathione reductase [Aquimixticola soesokkakensis]|uniref:Glutathione reductase n=1 Tax=Aquimixticola soesokkakensis TaxID=1519096 RepID=A0A1Y5SPP2_9RHOB|nr:NAD(P)/FAD-dependent oxidoreductase [Aquimixticola soesokkakensis]SLN45324.1 glutathione reductase [Aquimixticola soesokkakensis]
MAEVFSFDTIVLGAGAAGLMCAARASAKGARVLLVDHAKRAGEKIRISGGGRCNFTNMHCGANNFISDNPHFVKSALARYSQWDFLELVERYKIAWHEKTLGQLFCDGKSTQIIDMLVSEAKNVDIRLETSIDSISRADAGFRVVLSGTPLTTRHLVVATGGKSIPKMGASGLGYRIAEDFDIPVTPTRPALVPLTFAPQELAWIAPLAGTALPARLTANGTQFDEALLFTHRGLSGPAILQISSFWQEGDPLHINLAPQTDLFGALKAARHTNGRRQIGTALAELVPAKLAATLCERLNASGNMGDWSDKRLSDLCAQLHGLVLKPVGTEGYRTAEVTLGGVSTDALSSKTMESKSVPGLFFIGEVVDVTGWLGGFNFQWAWSSGVAAGDCLAAR